jgi:hypothetical protein
VKITKTAKRLNMMIGTMKMTNTTRFADANEDINIRRNWRPVHSEDEDSRRERNTSEPRK